MGVTYATHAGDGQGNEDYLTAGPDWAVILDGATAPAGVDSGCVHNVRWLVRELAAAITARMPATAAPLADLLAEAISDVCQAHGGACDLDNPDSPSSTVAMCRVTGPVLEYLSLADSAVLHARPGRATEVFVDDRTSHLPGGRPYPYALVRSLRNQADGFWVASTNPKAAYEAVQGYCELAGDSSVLLLTDGVTRLVELYGQPWDSLAAMAAAHGPGSLITAVRKLEDDQPPRHGKRHDDATAIHMTGFIGPRGSH
jgi:Protein phosphatase 2C